MCKLSDCNRASAIHRFLPNGQQTANHHRSIENQNQYQKKNQKKQTDRLVLFICVRRSVALFYDEYEFVVVHEFAYIFKVYYIWVAIAPT